MAEFKSRPSETGSRESVGLYIKDEFAIACKTGEMELSQQEEKTEPERKTKMKLQRNEEMWSRIFFYK